MNAPAIRVNVLHRGGPPLRLVQKERAPKAGTRRGALSGELVAKVSGKQTASKEATREQNRAVSDTRHLEQLEQIHASLAKLSGCCDDEHIARAAGIALDVVGMEIMAAEDRQSGDGIRQRHAEHIEIQLREFQSQLFEHKWDKNGRIRFVIAALDDSMMLRSQGISAKQLAERIARQAETLPKAATVPASIDQWCAAIEAWRGWNNPQQGGNPSRYRPQDIVYALMHGLKPKDVKDKAGQFFVGFKWPA